MDDIKDVQFRNFSKFLDQEIRTDPFGSNQMGNRAYRRAERIVAAIFLLTNHISSDEPLRRQIRSTSLTLFKHLLDVREELRSTHSDKLSGLQSIVRSLISQTRMLVFAGVVSSQNAEAVIGALDDFGALLQLSQRTALSEALRVSKEDLLHVPGKTKGHVKDIKDSLNIKDKSSIKDTISTQGQAISSLQSVASTRANSIIEALRAGGEMNIRDIAAHMPEHGEKTIQRELAVLISRGVVRRSGLRRWSLYSLATS